MKYCIDCLQVDSISFLGLGGAEVGFVPLHFRVQVNK